MIRKKLGSMLVLGFTMVSLGLVQATTASATAPSGAIFTTVVDGTRVNVNQYPAKTDVYLDGGPGPGAPATAAGLDDGTYVFQVTDPSGKSLLSQDPARCRQFTVSGGIITGVVAAGGCEHSTGVDVDHGAVTVQLMPYADTTNPGGEYKAWATKVADFIAGCRALGVTPGQELNVADCGNTGGNRHGFVDSDSKTDNYKVGASVPVEIDTRFHAPDGSLLDGMKATWTDTLGASNIKWSEWAPSVSAFHEAHVEAAERGTHHITVANQIGCTVGQVRVAGSVVGTGPQTVAVSIKNTNKSLTVFVDVTCN
jgi:hypothetical protein